MDKIEINPSSGKNIRLYNAQWDMIAAESSRLSTSRDELLRAIVDKYFKEDSDFRDIYSRFSDEADARLDALYLHICDWANQNSWHLVQESDSVEVYGVLDLGSGYVYIIRKAFNEVVREAGFTPREAVNLLKDAGLLKTRAKNNTQSKRINHVPTECYCVKLLKDEEEEEV